MQSLASTEISRVLEAGLFRSLSAPDRERISAQATLRELQNGETVFAAGDAAEAFFVVLSGRCEIHGVRRGDSEPTLLRVAERGQTLGEDAILAIAPRRTTAIAQTRATLLELSVALLRRAVERSDQSSWLEAQARELQQTAVADAVRLSALARELPQSAVSALCESAMFERIERGAKLYGVGERANHCFIIGDGLVQLSSRDGSVLAYLRRGDLVADSEVSSRANYAESAVALESGYVVKIDAQSMRSLSVRYPADLERARRIGIGRRELQQAVVSKASESATQHGFRDLHRLETAKSLLAIDLDLCVRCGHCSWACASLHGITRLVRRGDKLVTALKLVTPSGAIARARKNFLLPSSCQHCKHPACMLECPTGAIGRGSDGEVFIREELCTGCGACAKACPWDNIRMAETAHASTNKETRDVAVKCDLCRGY